LGGGRRRRVPVLGQHVKLDEMIEPLRMGTGVFTFDPGLWCSRLVEVRPLWRDGHTQ
jgi:hypothetical protein